MRSLSNVLMSSILLSRAIAFQAVGRKQLWTRAVVWQPWHNYHRAYSSTATTSLLATKISEADEEYMLQAVECAKLGVGHTFPNPAVGCVLVQEPSDDDTTGKSTILGKGFHPAAGFPHAEVFALLQAAGKVTDGVTAALSVVQQHEQQQQGGSDYDLVCQLTDQYVTDQEALFAHLFDDTTVTAYVTLEPCCHTGLTPPCASALVAANVDRVVIGVRDPNPRVDGGGVQLLQDAGIAVDLVPDSSLRRLKNTCADLVQNFGRRITPRPAVWPRESYNDRVTGSMRRQLRARAGRLKQDGELAQISWGQGAVDLEQAESSGDGVDLKPEWMEHLDGILWDKELVLVRLNGAVAKKKEAKALGSLIAHELQAHVAQTLGHTCLLYRPAEKPILDLEALVEEPSTSS